MIEQKSFFNIFEELENSRDNRGKIYPLIDIIIFTLYGVLAGFCDFINMSYYLKKREQERMTELGLSKDITSHDVFRVIDVEKFMALFVD